VSETVHLIRHILNRESAGIGKNTRKIIPTRFELGNKTCINLCFDYNSKTSPEKKVANTQKVHRAA
jgi:hypothetical protein